MKKKGLSYIAIAMLLLSAFTALPFTIAAGPAPPSMWIEPSTGISIYTNTTNVGYRFNVTVWADGGASKAFAWQFQMVWNTSLLNCTNGGYTAGGTSQWFLGHATIPSAFSFDNVAGNALHGESLIGADRIGPPSGSASLSWVEFEVISAPSKYQVLTDQINLVQIGVKTFIFSDPGVNFLTTVAGLTYTYTWAIPPFPTLTVDPDLVEYGPDPPNATGEVFDIAVKIMGLSAGWGLTNASFTLTYDDTTIEIADMTLNPAWGGSSNADNTTTPGDVVVFVEAYASPPPSGDVLVITIKFRVIYQGDYGDDRLTTLDLHDITLYDHVQTITTNEHDGDVNVYGLRTLPLPILEVSSYSFGPEPSVGKTFEITVSIKGLDASWYLIAAQFRLKYDESLILAVAGEEGDFLKSFAPYGTFYVFYLTEGDMNVAYGQLIMPNGTGYWTLPEFPNGDGVLATITFKVVSQPPSCVWPPEEYTCGLDLVEVTLIGVEGNETNTFAEIPYEPSLVNGTYSIQGTPATGRVIDVYGGALNRGYGATIFPAPFGGQGHNEPMDLVIPQSLVYLWADVAYNCWPVQSKEVGFEIEGPFDQETWDQETLTGEPKQMYHIRKYANITDANGMAWIRFQMPWPCENPQDYFGKYKVTVSVDICGVVVTDVLVFDYYYLIEITKVTTEKYYYYHDDYVCVTIDFKSKAQQEYPVLFSVVIQDELETHFWSTLKEMNVSGAEFCTWKEYEETVCLYIPKWAFAGTARIFVSAYDKDPTIGGAPWLPTYGLGWPLGATVPEIYILPTAPPTVYIDPESASMNVTAGEHVTFTAIASGGTGPYTYEWYFDGFHNPLWINPTFTLYVAGAGIHTITVVITDSYGYTATAEATVEIIV